MKSTYWVAISIFKTKQNFENSTTYNKITLTLFSVLHIYIYACTGLQGKAYFLLWVMVKKKTKLKATAREKKN